MPAGRPKRTTPNTDLQITFRLSREEMDCISKYGRGTTANSSLRYLLQLLTRIETATLRELRGYFEPNEWKYMLHALRDSRATIPIEMIRDCAPNAFLQQLPYYDQENLARLSRKINELNEIQVVTILVRIDGYWGSEDRPDIDEWAREI